MDKRLDGVRVEEFAGATGLERPASCVTGRCSNQLNYAPCMGQLIHLIIIIIIVLSDAVWLLSHAGRIKAD